MYYTYILNSLSTPGAIYVGYTSDINKRLIEHNSGMSIYTNKHKPWEIESYFAFTTRTKAQEFEKYLKSNSGKAFLLKRLVSTKFERDRAKYKNGHNQRIV